MRSAVRLCIAGVVVFGLAAAALILRNQLFMQKYAGFQKPAFVEIAKGTGTMRIGEQLAEAGVIRQSWQFAALRLLRFGKRLQAGDYQFKTAASASEVYDRIARGDVFYYELRIPEGSNIWDIAALIEEQGIVSSVDFLVAARDPLLVRDLSSRANSLEGFLFPATYKFKRHVSAKDVCRALTTQFKKVWKEVGGDKNVHDTVTLASMVEKEAKLAEERAQIAGVYANRLQAGMKLDCDPTVIYAALLDDRYRGTIYQSDLNSENPYNTYRHKGLPPGPIANPGRASLLAALEPDATKDLYFVARTDGSGAHVFSTNLRTHNQAVQQYRKGEAATVASKPGPRKASARRRR